MTLFDLRGSYLASDSLSESSVRLREPFIDMNGSFLVVLCQPERTLRFLSGLCVGLIWPSVGLRMTSVGLIRPRVGPRESLVCLRGHRVSLGAPGVSLRGPFVGLRDHV